MLFPAPAANLYIVPWTKMFCKTNKLVDEVADSQIG